MALAEQQGETQPIHVDLGIATTGPFITKLPGDMEIAEGMEVSLGAKSGSMHLFDETEAVVARARSGLASPVECTCRIDLAVA